MDMPLPAFLLCGTTLRYYAYDFRCPTTIKRLYMREMLANIQYIHLTIR